MVNRGLIKRFDVFLVNLDLTVGHEIKKTRPAVVVSPDEMNQYISTVIIAPMTTKSHAYPTRIPCIFEDKEGWVVLDQIRTVDKARLVSKLGEMEETTREEILAGLAAMFHE